jgi:hypothetical protein
MSHVRYPYRMSVCATGLSSVNYVYCRDARHASIRRFERPRAYLLLLMRLRQFGASVALRMLYPRWILTNVVVLLLLHCPRRDEEFSTEYQRNVSSVKATAKRPEVIFHGVTRVAEGSLFVELLTAWLYTTRGLAW